MKKTRILSVVAVLCLLLGMFAGAAVAEETPELKKIGVAFMKNDPFMVPLYNGMKEVCDANGIELIEYYAENDIEKQISQCDDLLQQDIDGLIVMPVDFEGITPALDAAQKAGVPVVSVDAACADAEKTIAYIASDNYKAGWLCGEHVLETLDSAKILVLSHPEIKCTIDRLQGFKDALEGHEGYEIISEQPCSGLYDKGMTIMDNWLQQYTDFNVVFAINDAPSPPCRLPTAWRACSPMRSTASSRWLITSWKASRRLRPLRTPIPWARALWNCSSSTSTASPMSTKTSWRLR